MDGADVNSFRLSAVKEKRFTVHLENKSARCSQTLASIDRTSRSLRVGSPANAAGADLTLSIRPNLDGIVSSKLALTGKSNAGAYKLTVL